MRIIKFIGIILLVLVLFSAGSIYFYSQQLKPAYEGEIVGLDIAGDVEVFFDGYGVPHIYGSNEEDVYTVFGYVHAQDRLWQMELIRRIASGRLSEIFGEELVETDKFFRTIGIDAYSRNTVEEMLKTSDSPEIRAANAYLKGINAFVEKGTTPIEYTILGLEKSNFSLVDVENVMGYMAFSFAMAHKTDPLATKILDTYGPGYLADLDVHVSAEFTLIPNFKGNILAKMGSHADRVLTTLPIAAFIGSNSWVIGPQKSASGKVMLANDPHIAFSQPGVWYEAHLHTPEWEIFGHYLAGYPFSPLFFNRNIATGLTMFENDDMDFYKTVSNVESTDKYRYNDAWVPFAIREELIRVKNADDISLKVRSTVQGPVITDVLEDLSDQSVISMWWTYTTLPGKILATMYNLGRATNLDEVQQQLANVHAPGLNVMYGDAKGNIAWWAAAKLPIRPDHVNSKIILDGTSDRDMPLGYLDFNQNPHAINPPWNYVYSANNQPDSINGSLYPGYYLPESRAKRIVDLLESKEMVDVEYFKLMLLDSRSSEAEVVAAELYSVINSSAENKKLIGLLNGWKGTHEPDEVAPVLYHKLLYHILSMCMEDELEDSFERFIDTHFYQRSVKGLVLNDSSVWWDNVHTSEVETRREIFLTAYELSVKELDSQLGEDFTSWRWGDVHTLEHQHPLGQVELLRSYFNVGPFNVGATTNVLNNQMFKPTGEGIYKVFAGPSTRRIIDFGDIENSLSILPTGQSGNIMSKHYSDQAEMYNKGQFRVQLINKNEIELNSTKLRFVAE